VAETIGPAIRVRGVKDEPSVITNGFGFVARVAALASANAAVGRGFAYFALSKSIYYRWIARGHEVQFPKDTQIEILPNER
jgi:hypothetical protein